MRKALEVVREGSINPFYIDELLSYLKIDISSYNFVFSDVDAYILDGEEEISLDIFDNEYCLLSGEELLNIIEKYNILIIFGVITLIHKKNVLGEIKKLPKIQNNPNYWEEDYISTIPNFDLEIGLSDTTNVLFTVKDPKKMKELNIDSIDLNILGANFIQL